MFYLLLLPSFSLLPTLPLPSFRSALYKDLFSFSLDRQLLLALYTVISPFLFGCLVLYTTIETKIYCDSHIYLFSPFFLFGVAYSLFFLLFGIYHRQSIHFLIMAFLFSSFMLFLFLYLPRCVQHSLLVDSLFIYLFLVSTWPVPVHHIKRNEKRTIQKKNLWKRISRCTPGGFLNVFPLFGNLFFLLFLQGDKASACGYLYMMNLYGSYYILLYCFFLIFKDLFPKQENERTTGDCVA